jgi:hypothetical protein
MEKVPFLLSSEAQIIIPIILTLLILGIIIFSIKYPVRIQFFIAGLIFLICAGLIVTDPYLILTLASPLGILSLFWLIILAAVSLFKKRK